MGLPPLIGSPNRYRHLLREKALSWPEGVYGEDSLSHIQVLPDLRALRGWPAVSGCAKFSEINCDCRSQNSPRYFRESVKCFVCVPRSFCASNLCVSLEGVCLHTHVCLCVCLYVCMHVCAHALCPSFCLLPPPTPEGQPC